MPKWPKPPGPRFSSPERKGISPESIRVFSVRPLLLGQPAVVHRGVDTRLQSLEQGVFELARLDAETVGRVVEDGATLVVRRESARGGDRSGRAEGDGDEGGGHQGRDDLRSGEPAHERHQTTVV